MAKTATRTKLTTPFPDVAQPIATRRVTHLNLCCPAFGVADGYGNSAEQMALALDRSGLSLTLAGITRRAGHQNAAEIFDRVPIMGDAILFYSPPVNWLKQLDGRPSYGFTMYESDRVPRSWVAPLDRADEIWVPSTWNAEIFAACTTRPVHVIPLGVDANAFAYARRTRGAKFRVLSMATYAQEPRKGIDLAIRAFKAAFGDRDDVEMVVHSTYPGNVHKDDARIQRSVRQFTTPALADFYREFDVLLYPSLGEGFGLIPLEAMATGMPAIFATATGMRDYSDLGLTVGTHKIPATTGHDSTHDGTATPYGCWHEPHLDELVDRLRAVESHYELAMDHATRDSMTIADRWTWDASARAMIARLNA